MKHSIIQYKRTEMGLVLFLLTLFLLPTFTVSAQDHVWAKGMGGTSHDFGNSLAVDGQGNVYTTGYFQGMVDFDPSDLGEEVLSSVSGGADIFISKMNADGTFAWAKGMGGTSYDYGYSIAVDGQGNVYTTGIFNGMVDFDPSDLGEEVLSSIGNTDIFISKLDTDGAFVWAKRVGEEYGEDGNSLAVDGQGNVYIAGPFSGTVDFDPSDLGIEELMSFNGNYDSFIFKLDTDGTFVWAKRMGGGGGDILKSVAVDGQGNVYTTGYFNDTADFNPDPDETAELESAGNADVFISKLDTDGTFVWANRMGGATSEIVKSIAIDGQGNVYTTGYFSGTADFDPGEGTTELTHLGSQDIFIAKLNADGTFAWAKGIGGTGVDDGHSLAVDGQGNVYTTGFFHGPMDFDPGVGIANLTSPNFSYDIFISKLDTDGTFVWAKRMGGGDTDDARSIAIDGRGNIYTTGTFNSTVDFDPGTGTENLISAGSYDIFIAKYCQKPTTPGLLMIQPNCDVATGTVTVTAQYEEEIYSFDNGLNFQVGNSKSGLEPGNYEVIIMSAAGCRSIATQAVVDAQPVVPTAPEITLIQPTCDLATGTITVTAQNEGETYSFDNGETFQESNSKSDLATDTYEVIIKSSDGCHSAATQAVVDAQPVTPTTPVITSITQPTCEVATGIITVTEQNEGEIYSFDNGESFQSENSKSELTSGTYEVIIKSIGECNSVATQAIVGAQPVTPAVPEVTMTPQFTCDPTPGTGIITVTEQNEGDTYSFDSGETFQDGNSKSDLTPGDYKVIIMNACGNSVIEAVSVFSQPVTPAAPEIIINQPTCNIATGTITVTAQNEGETYSFDSGDTFQDDNFISDLAAGTYGVIMMDLGGCLSIPIQAVVDAQPVVPTAPEITLIQPTCDLATGTITVTAQNEGETYSFDNGLNFQESNSKSELTPGNYKVIIKNACGNSTSIQAVVNAQPVTPAVPEITSITQPTCDVATGTVTVNEQIVGETYSFDNGGEFQSSNSKSGLLPGIYEVIIMSAGECNSTSTQAVVNAQPVTPAAPEITSIIHPTCDVATGTITVTEQIAGETYSFDNGATFQAENVKLGLEVGTYEVIIKSADECSSIATQTVIDAQPVTPAKPEITSNIDDPKAHVLTSSNASDNQWYLNDEPIAETTNATLTVTVAGEYTVQTILGTCKSELSDSFSIEDQSITFATIDDQILEAGTLILGATVPSGLEVSYEIVSGSATLVDNVVTFTDLGMVTVSASQTGSAAFFAATAVEQSFEVITITSMEKNPASTISFYPNPARNYITVQSKDKLVQVEVLDMSGKQMMIEHNVQLDISKLKAGNYLLKVMTANEVSVHQFIKQ